MRNPLEVLRIKEQEILRVKKVDALRITAKLLGEDSKPMPEQKVDLRQVIEMP